MSTLQKTFKKKVKYLEIIIYIFFNTSFIPELYSFAHYTIHSLTNMLTQYSLDYILSVKTSLKTSINLDPTVLKENQRFMEKTFEQHLKCLNNYDPKYGWRKTFVQLPYQERVEIHAAYQYLTKKYGSPNDIISMYNRNIYLFDEMDIKYIEKYIINAPKF